MDWLFHLSRDDGSDDWLLGASSAIDCIKKNVHNRRVVLYACLSNVLIHAVFVPKKKAKFLDKDELERFNLFPDACWSICRTMYGRGKCDVYISQPFEKGSVLEGAEKIIFIRDWEGCRRSALEISQRMVHALDVHYVEERRAFCRIDSYGDIENVINIDRSDGVGLDEHYDVVTIDAESLYRYAALSAYCVFFFYDFTRFRVKNFVGWGDKGQYAVEDESIFCHGATQPGVGSYVNGWYMFFPPITKKDIVKQCIQEYDGSVREYAVFKIYNRDGERQEWSCDPKGLANYFQRESRLPLEITPVFFRPEVLLKYKADTAKYSLEDRRIYCRGAWHLETYDINEDGQVHTYLIYLSRLPFSEQLYWQSFNVWPTCGLSKRAIKTDFEGAWDLEYDCLSALKIKVEKVNRASPVWWLFRSDSVVKVVNYVVTDSQDEWSNAILLLDQLVVEGFSSTGLAGVLKEIGGSFDGKMKSLGIIREIIRLKNLECCDLEGAIKAIRELHEMRNVTKGHASERGKSECIKHAVRQHGSLKAHYKALIMDVDIAFGAIAQMLGVDV